MKAMQEGNQNQPVRDIQHEAEVARFEMLLAVFNRLGRYQPALKAFQAYKQISNEPVIADILHSMCHIQYFLKACPEGVKLNDFVKQATPYLSYEHFQRGKSIFHFGDAGDRFYIVLKGRVGVQSVTINRYVPKSQQQIDQEIEILTEHNHESQGRLQRGNTIKIAHSAESDYMRFWQGKKDSLTAEQEALLLLNDKKQLYFMTDRPSVAKFHKVYEYHAGCNFGELALTTDQARAATLVVMTQEAHLLSMTKADFKKLSEKQIQSMNARIDYYMHHFDGVSKQTVIKFTNNFHEHTFNTSTELWKEGDLPTFFFLIKRGRCELYRYVQEKEIIDRATSSHPSLRKGGRTKKIILSTLSDNSFIGTDDIIEGSKQRSYYCKVTEVTEAYYMSTEDFNSVRKAYPDIVKCLRDKYRVMSKYMSQRQVSIVANQKQVQTRLQDLTHVKAEPIERVTVEEMEPSTEPAEVPDNFIRSYQPLILTKTEIANKNEQLHNVLVKRAEMNLGHDPTKQFNMISRDALLQIEQRIQRKFASMRGHSSQPKSKISSSTSAEILVHHLNRKKSQREDEQANYQRSVNDLFQSFGNVIQTDRHDSVTSFTFNNKRLSIVQPKHTPLLLTRAFNPKYQDRTKLLSSIHNQDTNQLVEANSAYQDASNSNIFQTEVRRLHSAAKPLSRVRKGLSIPQVGSQHSIGSGYLSTGRHSYNDQQNLLVSPTRVQTHEGPRPVMAFKQFRSTKEIQLP